MADARFFPAARYPETAFTLGSWGVGTNVRESGQSAGKQAASGDRCQELQVVQPALPFPPAQAPCAPTSREELRAGEAAEEEGNDLGFWLGDSSSDVLASCLYTGTKPENT